MEGLNNKELITVPKRKTNNASVVLVLDRNSIERLEQEPGGTDLLLRDDMLVLDQGNGDQELVDLLDDEGLLRRGALLVRSPYSGSFAHAHDAAQQFALEKHFLFTTICSLLGAKEVRVEQIDIIVDNDTTSFDLGASQIAFDAKLGIKKQLFEELTSKMSLHDVFEGNDRDVGAAEEMLRANRLRADWNLRSLVEISKGPNRLKSRELILNLTDESKRNLKVAASVDVPAYLRADVGFESVKEQKIEYRLKVRVSF